MARHCVCGKIITINSSLCNDCLKVHGTDRNQWPEWVRFLVAEEQKELDRERRHRELQLDEEHPLISDLAEHNLARAKRHPEMDFEDFTWNNQ